MEETERLEILVAREMNHKKEVKGGLLPPRLYLHLSVLQTNTNLYWLHGSCCGHCQVALVLHYPGGRNLSLIKNHLDVYMEGKSFKEKNTLKLKYSFGSLFLTFASDVYSTLHCSFLATS